MLISQFFMSYLPFVILLYCVLFVIYLKNKKNNIIFHMLSTVFVFALFFDKGLLKNTFLLSIVQIHSKNHSWREST